MRAWLFQDSRQKAKLGEAKCPWSVGWLDPDGRRRSKRVGSKSMAEKFRRKREGELAAGLIETRRRDSWESFRARYKRYVLPRVAATTATQYERAFDHVQRVLSPRHIDSVTTASLDRYSTQRLTVDGVSPATLNKKLRHLRAALRKARSWKLIQDIPEFPFAREPERHPEYVDDPAFAKLYNACDEMTQPRDGNYTPAEWWRALLTFGYLTGWRISEILAVRRHDVDFQAGTAFIPADQTKGRRDATVELHPAILDHLRTIAGFRETLFFWPLHERMLWTHFAKLKAAANVEFAGAFHRLRFGFANANVDRVDEDVLQRLMRHRDRQTTRHYVNAVERMRRQGTADKLHVPAVLRRAN